MTQVQILPQLLYFLKVENDYNSLDWATIVVYTCEASCDGSLSCRRILLGSAYISIKITLFKL
ncbi:putative programmed cell death protein [Helianthus annuus]|nr:putative programmed cell death protein [Helianthus annuus]KAJ0597263.1 putative programmed cell death protein [Helianthus annuus]KAJ0757943.1 putative programmed cell death protein [Helianthus annuus]KAJ0761610.1 putative programmed cell death protein [Helianthus annuus]